MQLIDETSIIVATMYNNYSNSIISNNTTKTKNYA